jgi:hypothetical protein
VSEPRPLLGPDGWVLVTRTATIDWLFVPLYGAWLAVNVGLYPAYPEFVFRVGSFTGRAGEIFPFTWSAALTLFVYGLWLFGIRYRVDALRTILYSVGLAFAATSMFEILYQNVGAGYGVGNQMLEGQLINLTAIALAAASVRFWSWTSWLGGAGALYAFGWVLWLGVGYPQIFDTEPTQAHVAYVFNALLKVASFVLLGLLVLPARRSEAQPLSRARPSGV